MDDWLVRAAKTALWLEEEISLAQATRSQRFAGVATTLSTSSPVGVVPFVRARQGGSPAASVVPFLPAPRPHRQA